MEEPFGTFEVTSKEDTPPLLSTLWHTLPRAANNRLVLRRPMDNSWRRNHETTAQLETYRYHWNDMRPVQLCERCMRAGGNAAGCGIEN